MLSFLYLELPSDIRKGSLLIRVVEAVKESKQVSSNVDVQNEGLLEGQIRFQELELEKMKLQVSEREKEREHERVESDKVRMEKEREREEREKEREREKGKKEEKERKKGSMS